MKEVAVFFKQTEADLAKSFLEEQGIPTYVESDNLGHLYFFIGTKFGARVMVLNPEDYHKAKELLKQNDFSSKVHKKINFLDISFINLILGFIILIPPFSFLAMYYSIKAIKQFPEKRVHGLGIFIVSLGLSIFWTIFFAGVLGLL